jgi:hypothetical protein
VLTSLGSRAVLAAAPGLLGLALVLGLSVNYCRSEPNSAVQDVDVLVVKRQPSPTALTQTLDDVRLETASVRSRDFEFHGWIDTVKGYSLVLTTDDGPEEGRGNRMRLRTLRRPDVADIRGDDLLYSGFAVEGKVTRWGRPTCLIATKGRRSFILWPADRVSCATVASRE